jgi:hypothetical protein
MLLESEDLYMTTTTTNIERICEKARDPYAGRKYLYLFPCNAETYYAVNYDATNNGLNAFLQLFNFYGPEGGEFKLSEDENHSEVWFKVDDEFYRLAKYNTTFRRAIERAGVKIVFEYPFNSTDPKLVAVLAPAKAIQDLRDRWHFFGYLHTEVD